MTDGPDDLVDDVERIGRSSDAAYRAMNDAARRLTATVLNYQGTDLPPAIRDRLAEYRRRRAEWQTVSDLWDNRPALYQQW
jgi:hypothetical protein